MKRIKWTQSTHFSGCSMVVPPLGTVVDFPQAYTLYGDEGSTNLKYKRLAFCQAYTVYKYNNCVHCTTIATFYILQHNIQNYFVYINTVCPTM